MKKVKDDNMGNSQSHGIVPLPTLKTERKLVQAEISIDIRNAVLAEIGKYGNKKNAPTMTDVVEWGLKQYLLVRNPVEAAKLGIKADK